MFFKVYNADNFNLRRKERENSANFIGVEDKYDKMKKFVTKSDEDNENNSPAKREDMIFFKLLKNFSTVCCEKKDSQNVIVKTKSKTKERMFGNQN